jgi:hypothetical protein
MESPNVFVTISGGTISAAGGNCSGKYSGSGAGIGNSGSNIYSERPSSTDIRVTISGGMVSAVSGNSARSAYCATGAGIGGGGGGGDLNLKGVGGDGGSVSISGGIVIAAAGDCYAAACSGGGAGIGGGGGGYSTGRSDSCSGIGGAGGSVKISGGTVSATASTLSDRSGRACAGIGGGGGERNGGAAASTITGGSVNADFEASPNDGSGSVYLTRVTLSPPLVSADVRYRIGGGSFVTCATDENGVLYLWLPSGALEDCRIEGLSNSSVYVAGGSVAADNGIPSRRSPRQVGKTIRRVFADAWYYCSVRFVSENGLMNGTGGGLFSPGARMTRAMFVTILHRMSGDTAAIPPGSRCALRNLVWQRGRVGSGQRHTERFRRRAIYTGSGAGKRTAGRHVV